ncbi:MAG: preprotein translocase subunit SecG [Desulfomonile tiedjei]|uniref:Protein-export membrane protein SecG n=1 Tax=Desulfomonile tiedjei TaxID=2358 RepID=A0A9D6YZ00_9BACT|nr:preprotein translocase subunit SecG [Desulfomonile tiedjei]
MFTTFILMIHVVVCIALILIILLQSGKGADIGAAFGGGSSQTVFGSTGATPFLSKVTIGAAVAFMVTSIILTYFSGRVPVVQERSIMTEQSGPQVPGPASGPSDAAESGGVPSKGESSTQSGVPAPNASPPAQAAPSIPAAPPGQATPQGESPSDK